MKLKDFPWNGWLSVGVEGRARRLEPVAGFSDPAGRLVWAAVGDPALLLDPDNARFIPNRARVQSIEEAARSRRCAGPSAGRAQAPGPASPRARLVYRVLLSNFHDGQR